MRFILFFVVSLKAMGLFLVAKELTYLVWVEEAMMEQFEENMVRLEFWMKDSLQKLLKKDARKMCGYRSRKVWRIKRELFIS